MTGPTESLEILIIEGRPPSTDLDDVVDFQFSNPKSNPTIPASEPISMDHEGAGGIPEIASLKPPTAASGAIWSAAGKELDPTLNALSGPASRRLLRPSFGEPRGRTM